MSKVAYSLPVDYWSTILLGKADLNFISNYLFEIETPLSEQDIVPIIIEERIRREREALFAKYRGDRKVFLPGETHQVGDSLVFPALGWMGGKVIEVRAGVNPIAGIFNVIVVEMEDARKRQFASELADHVLNHPEEQSEEDDSLNPGKVITSFREQIEVGVSKGLREDDNLVQIAGRWFPRALLIDINIGHLNLAEAVLDEAGGAPLTTEQILEQVALPVNESRKLVEFSMNYALQEDSRFDEVGPEGEVLWCLKRLEPQDVQQIPQHLRYVEIQYERSILTKEMLDLETVIDDELGASEEFHGDANKLTISLTYPHWRAGTLPISNRTRKFFPTAYESERVRFVLIDEQSKEEIPAWVVRHHGYVAGLKNYYAKYGLIPGSLVNLRRGSKAGQVIIEAQVRRPVREWVRTVLVGSDGGIVFANLKQNLTTIFNEKMVIAVPDAAGVDAACELITKKRMPFENLVLSMMQELVKMNIQGHVHAQEIYSALNIVRRCPLGPILAQLSNTKVYNHVGDLHYRLNDTKGENE